MAALGRILLSVLGTIVGFFTAQLAGDAVGAGGALLIRAAVVTAWGFFLAAFFTGISGLALTSIINANPLTNATADAVGLASAAFPLHFMFGLVVGYIVFKMTVMQAAIVMSRTIKFLFGG